MDWKAIRREWRALVPVIQDRWPDADEDELLELDGTRDALAEYLARATGEDLDEILEELSDWRMGGIPADVRFNEINDNLNIHASARSIPAGEDVYDDDRAFGDDSTSDPPVGRD
ncbi:MAG: hypothetical protein ACU0DK_05150 [Pseudooceanicola sp.]